MAAFQMTPGQPAGSGRIARVTLMRSLAEAELCWDAIANAAFLATPYQTFGLLNAWQSHIGKNEAASPLVVVAYDHENRPLVIMPLAVSHENGSRVARYIGGKHLTFNMPIWRHDFVASATAGDVRKIIEALCLDGIDVLALTQQPENWDGIANPLAKLAAQSSTNRCPMMLMPAGTSPDKRISSSTRRKLRSKERKLQALPGYRYIIAKTDDDIERLLNSFFAVKPLRMALSKLPNIFEDEATKSFIRDACLNILPNGERAITIHAIECDAEMLAIFACVADEKRFSTMFNTYTVSENAKYSPGLVLLRQMIDHYADQGCTAFDFGIGSDEYKKTFCKEDEPLIDSFIPLTSRGKLAAIGMSSLTHAKRLVKQNPAMMRMARLLRNALNR